MHKILINVLILILQKINPLTKAKKMIQINLMRLIRMWIQKQ